MGWSMSFTLSSSSWLTVAKGFNYDVPTEVKLNYQKVKV
jgi:hypothetical protein